MGATTDYLCSVASFEDLRRLLSPKCPKDEDGDPCVRRGLHTWFLSQCGPWQQIALCVVPVERGAARQHTVYVAPDDGGFVVSDCGQAASNLMIRTGWPSKHIDDMLFAIVHHAALTGHVDHDVDLRSHGGGKYECPGGRSRETAILSVLLAVAMAAELKR